MWVKIQSHSTRDSKEYIPLKIRIKIFFMFLMLPQKAWFLRLPPTYFYVSYQVSHKKQVFSLGRNGLEPNTRAGES